MITDLIPLLLSLTIASSWNRFRIVFSETRDQTILLAPDTAIASTLSVSAAGLAWNNYGLAQGGMLVALGIALAVATAQLPNRSSVIKTALPAGSLLLYVHLC
jgi:hypothetical protein